MIKKRVKGLLDKTTVDDKLVGHAREFKKEVRKHIATAILAAFGFIMALTWRDALQEVINNVVAKLGVQESAHLYKIYVAIAVTILCVIGIFLVSRWGGKQE
jgi:hypothetical protein